MGFFGQQRQAWGQSRRQHGACYYTPTWPILSFIVGAVGLILWYVCFDTAFDKTNHVLDSLAIDNRWKKDLGLGSLSLVIIYGAMLVIMLVIALWRSTLARRVDNEGRASRSSTLFLTLSAFFTLIMWLLMALLLAVFLGTIVWGVTMYRMHDDALYSLKRGSQFNQLQSDKRCVDLGIVPSQVGGYCPGYCMDLQKMGIILDRDECVCDPNVLKNIQDSAGAAYEQLWQCAIGLTLMTAAGSWLLMCGAAQHSYARTQRVIYQRGAASIEAPHLEMHTDPMSKMEAAPVPPAGQFVAS